MARPGVRATNDDDRYHPLHGERWSLYDDKPNDERGRARKQGDDGEPFWRPGSATAVVFS